MKKLILILLVGILCISVFTIVSAKISFGGWDRWDEELPPAEHKYWYWAVPDNEPRIWNLEGIGNEGSDVVLWFSDLYFYRTKSGKTKASVIFYSLASGDGDEKDWDIPNASFALAAFPPKKGKMVVRAYKMEKKVFRFFEEWQIPFKNHQVVVQEDAKFREVFKEWLAKQISPEIIVPEDMIEMMLPELVIWKKKFFMITDSQKLSENK